MNNRKFKPNTYLTDGKHIIKIGIVTERTWTPSNNYGNKKQLLTHCKSFPMNLVIDGTLVVRENYLLEIPAIWFQEGYMLSHFMEINKKLLNAEILEKLK